MTRTTVLGVEVRQFADEGGDHRTFVPTIIGLTEQAKLVKVDRKWRRWNASQWMALHEARRESEDVAVTRRLVKWAEGRGIDLAYGTAISNPARAGTPSSRRSCFASMRISGPSHRDGRMGSFTGSSARGRTKPPVSGSSAVPCG